MEQLTSSILSLLHSYVTLSNLCQASRARGFQGACSKTCVVMSGGDWGCQRTLLSKANTSACDGADTGRAGAHVMIGTFLNTGKYCSKYWSLQNGRFQPLMYYMIPWSTDRALCK